MRENRLSNITASTIFKSLAIISVLVAYVIGLLGEKRDCQEKLSLAFPDMSIISSSGKDPVCYRAAFPEGEKYVLISKTMGWGGPALVATKIDSLGYVEDVRVVDNKETPAFFAQLKKESYFDQFKGKYIGDSYSTEKDVEVVSGATISSKAFNAAIKKNCHFLANTQFQKNIPEKKISISFSDQSYFILLLFTLAFLGARFGFSKYRIVIQIMSIVILGFMLNYSFSVSHIASLFMGFFPKFQSHLIWYILVGGIIAMILFVGKNFYCTWICPFGAIQDLLNKASDISLPISPWIKKYGQKSSGIIAWFSVCVIFITRNPAIGSFEPFAALFSFKGFGIIWVVLPVLIFSSFFIKRMWCRFFCPVGFFLNRACKIRSSVVKQKYSKIPLD